MKARQPDPPYAEWPDLRPGAKARMAERHDPGGRAARERVRRLDERRSPVLYVNRRGLISALLDEFRSLH